MKYTKISKLATVAMALFAFTAIGLAWLLLSGPGAIRADSPSKPTGLTTRESWFPSFDRSDGMVLNWTAPSPDTRYSGNGLGATMR